LLCRESRSADLVAFGRAVDEIDPLGVLPAVTLRRHVPVRLARPSKTYLGIPEL
jgi:hypothetical protein